MMIYSLVSRILPSADTDVTPDFSLELLEKRVFLSAVTGADPMAFYLSLIHI